MVFHILPRPNFFALPTKGFCLQCTALCDYPFEGASNVYPLVTYVNDHLGGAQVAVQLLEAMRNQQGDQEFRQFASVLLPEIQADDLVLRRIAKNNTSGPSTIKQLGKWLLRKPHV